MPVDKPMAEFDRFVLAQYPHHRAPRRYLRDPRRFVGQEPTTTVLSEAWMWRERTGPYQLMRRQPHLKRKFFPLALTMEQVREAGIVIRRPERRAS